MTDALGKRFFENGKRATAAVTIQRSAEELYAVWCRFEDLPRFIDDLESVTRTGEELLWKVKGPGGRSYSWNARIINDEPGRMLAWRTDDEGVPNAGSIRFEEQPFRRGTEVHVVVEYLPPGGTVGDVFAKAVGKSPEGMLQRGLFQFRQMMETGEVATSHGQPVGANARRTDRPGEGERATDTDLQDIARKENGR
ncbi:MAG: SRPBCC family protein [Planctomycetota bacterium]|nr:SRPBCC family protein [Planctomycetota bacterium]